MSTNKPWYQVDDQRTLDSPSLLIYPERVKENIRILKNMTGDTQKLRPHVKTHKTIEATVLMMEAGISKFKCATIAEAEMLGMVRAPDVLLAYQPVGPKIERLVSLIRKYPQTNFSCLTDHIDAAGSMNAVFQSNNLQVPVYLDLNLGQNRTGIDPGDQAVSLYDSCYRMTGIKPVGLHAYDGHIRDRDFAEKKKKCDEAFASVQHLKNTLVARGFEEPVIVVGGSPTFSIHCTRPGVECSPGTFVFWDKGYSDLCPEQSFVPAAILLGRVISLPDSTKVCIDMGHKSVAAENELARRVYFINAPGLRPVSQSEEHLVAEAGQDHPFKIGHVLYGIPIHVCPSIALYERAYTVENNQVTGEWKILARDRKIGV
jgi:D-serine deaminase-like pyridoxal phosphate-dependent protein